MKMGVKTFELPSDDKRATLFMNEEGITIVNKQTFFSAKEGLLLLYLEYEQAENSIASNYHNEEEEGVF